MSTHATCVARDGDAFLLCGPSGCGKSDLALRLLDSGWLLVSDDRVEVERDGNQVITKPPAAIRGLLEVRGLGIVPVSEDKICDRARLAGIVTLVPTLKHVERMPDAKSSQCCELSFPATDLYPFETSAVAKLAVFHDLIRRNENEHASS